MDFVEHLNEITKEDNTMLFKLIASLNGNNYSSELDWEGLMSALDVIHLSGAEVAIMYGHSVYIHIGEEYFNRVEVTDDLASSIFDALHHFSHWYLKNKV